VSQARNRTATTSTLAALPLPPRGPGAFSLDPSWDFLNHGSFGACPTVVREAQRRVNDELEAQPVRFLVRELPDRLDALRLRFGAWLGADPAGLCFVPNATTAVAAALSAAPLRPGDRILTTTHRYNAVRRALDVLAAERGAVVDEAPLPARVSDPAQLIAALFDRVRPETRLLVVDQITSPTALRLPVERICAEARARGLLTLIDGAHAPGHVPVDLGLMGPDWWLGNLHKWLCAPRGAALLWVAPAHRASTHHPVPSHGRDLGLHQEFDWPGTFDPSPWLAAETALALHEAWGGPALMEDHAELAASARALLCAALGVEPPVGEAPGLRCAMAAVPLPLPPEAAMPLHHALHEARFELPVQGVLGGCWLRVSAFAAYNRLEQFERLAALLPGLVDRLRG
jgi:isopenicillin-N epimerase